MRDQVGPADALVRRPPSLTDVLRSGWPLVLVASLLAGVGVGVVSAAREPVYRASGQVLLARPDEVSIFRSSVNSRDLERRILDEVERAESAEVLERLALELGPGWTLGRVRRSTQVTASPSSNYLQFDARAPSPAQAAEVVDAHVGAYQAVVQSQAEALTERTLERVDEYLGQLTGIANRLRDDLDARRQAVEAELQQAQPDDDVTRQLDLRLESDQTYRSTLQELDATNAEIQTLRSEALRFRIDAALQSSIVELYEPARARANPVSPRPLRDATIVGALAAVIASAFLWVRAEARSRRLDPERAARMLGTSVVGRTTAGSLTLDESRGARLPSLSATVVAIELELLKGRPVRVVVTGMDDRADTGELTIALGVALAERGSRVVVVDTYAREQGLTDRQGLDGETGLSDLLAGRADVAAAVHDPIDAGASPSRPLTVVPRGRSADPQAPTGRELHATLDRLADDVDLLLVDAPPVSRVPDAAVMARAGDYVLAAVGEDPASDSLEAAVVALSRSAGSVLGVVVVGPDSGWPLSRLAHGRTGAPPAGEGSDGSTGVRRWMSRRVGS